MTPYNHSYNNSYDYHTDPSELRCRICHTATIIIDHSQGDAICTSCGLVQAQKIPYNGAEWRDYSAMNDEDKRNIARAGGSTVDESRWNGGLEPTTLGPVFGGYHGDGVDGERQRKRLGKVKRVVDHWVEKQFEKKVEESRLAMKLKAKKKIRADNLNGKQNERSHSNIDGANGNGIDQDEQDWTDLGTNEHEQIARQRMEEIESSHKMLVSEKWSLDRALLLHGATYEIPSRYTSHNPLSGERPRDIQHEREILIKRMDVSQRKASQDLYKMYKLMTGALKRLDLDTGEGGGMGLLAEVMDAIGRFVNLKGGFTVKGVSTKIPTGGKARTKGKNVSSSSSSSSSSIEEHRNFNKVRQMGAIGSALIYLICKKNGLGRSLAEICGSLVHQDASLDLLGTGSITMHSNSHPSARSLQKQHQNQIEDNSQQQQQQPFIKAKHCSKAVTEIRSLMPDYVQFITMAVGKSSEEGQSSTTSSNIKAEVAPSPANISKAVKPECVSSRSSSSPVRSDREIRTMATVAAVTAKPNSNINVGTHMATVTTNMVQHSMKKINLPAIAIRVITNLVIHVQTNPSIMEVGRGSTIKGFSEKEVKRPAILVAALAYLICDAGGIMQKLAVQATAATASSATSNSSLRMEEGGNIKYGFGKRKHIRPGGNRRRGRGMKRRRIEAKPTNDHEGIKKVLEANLTSVEDASQVTSVTPEPEPMDILSCDVVELEEIKLSPPSSTSSTPMSTCSSLSATIPSWTEWKRQKAWRRKMEHIEHSCSTSSMAARDYYKKIIYPRRKELLETVQKIFGHDSHPLKVEASNFDNGCQVDVLVGNIAVAAPLMSSTPK